MSDSSEVSANPGVTGNANIIYILYLVGIATCITTIIGVIMAYVAKDEAPDWLKTHYHNQIHVFWKLILYSIICAALTLVVIGLLLFVVLLIWYIVRCVKGLQYASRGEAYPNPSGWGF
ncbi:DUF4870 domain-containing protein [Parvularcula sp. IMCC14364]|uniref:DUF4870 family protein n=1 Tax=Parvularcula sp. IMCC14364 TaxID=3067902 RepID=UPI002741890C|nr:DUF4870 domain-containing protein [Parvularcula sp. IMCC14364]